MKLFNLNIRTYEVEFEESALLLAPFSALFNRDKTPHKDIAIKELGFIYFFADMRSDYQTELDEGLRTQDIVTDLQLPKNWKPDKLVKTAIEFYRSRSRTPVSAMYEGAIVAAESINKICLTSDRLIQESSDPIAAAQKVIGILEKIPKTMANLTAAHKELVKEHKETEGRSKGAKTFNEFEDGL